MVDDETLRVLGPHLLLAPLADGGMGAVFLATQAAPLGPRTLSLVKTLKSGLASVSDYRPRFIDETRVAVLLRHENLCQVFGGGEANGEFFLAMELIEGVTFKRLVSLLQRHGHRLSTTQAAALTVGLLRGLHAAHTATADDGRHLGVVHRDVSPHNVMVDITGHIKVIDFGLATSVLKETFTESAVVLGKSAYMAPEQARGEDVDAAVDQYAAAIVLFELLTNDRFYGDMPTRTIWSVVGAGSHRPRAWQNIPEAFRPLLQRALSPRPADRFADCHAFADAIVAVDPFACSAGIAEELGATVEALAPDELSFIAAAREQMLALGSRDFGLPSSSSSLSLLPSPPPSGAREDRADRSQPVAGYGQTESVSRSVSTRVADDSEQRETAATAVATASAPGARGPAPMPDRSRAVPIAAAVGVVVVLALIVAGVLVVRGQQRRLDRLVDQIAATTPVSLVPATVPPVVAITPPPPLPPAPEAPVAGSPSRVPRRHEGAARETRGAARETRGVKREKRREEILNTLRGLKKSCAKTCVAENLKMLEEVQLDKIDIFDISSCEKQCR